MMKLRILLAFFALMVCRSSSAQNKIEDSTVRAQELIRIEQKLLDGIATGDSALWIKYLSKDFMIVNEDGSRTFYTEFIHSLNGLPKGSSGYINIIKPHFHFLDNIAVFNYTADEYESVMGQKLHTSYAIMQVYQKQEAIWTLMNSEVFEIPQLPPVTQVDIKILSQYVGDYYFTDTDYRRITLEHSHVFIQKPGKAKEEIYPETSSVFFRKTDARGRLLFKNTGKGKWMMLQRRNGQDLRYIRKDKK